MYNGDYLIHYGTIGMRWGHRKDRGNKTSNRYQRKADKYRKKLKRGSLWTITSLGSGSIGMHKLARKEYARAEKKEAKWKEKAEKYEKKAKASKNDTSAKKSSDNKQALKTAAKIGLGVTAGLLAAYGGYKVNQSLVQTKALQNVTNSLLAESANVKLKHIQLETFMPETFTPDTFVPKRIKLK